MHRKNPIAAVATFLILSSMCGWYVMIHVAVSKVDFFTIAFAWKGIIFGIISMIILMWNFEEVSKCALKK